MNYMEFCALCGEFNIDPDIAVENANVRQAIIEKRFDDIRGLLETEF